MAATVKFLVSVLKYFFYTVWGLTVVEILPLITWDNFKNFEFVHGFDNIVKTTTALLGLIYFAIEIPNRLRKAKLERKILEEDLRKKKYDNDQEQGDVKIKNRNEDK